MAKYDPAKVTEKQIRRGAAATEDYISGVDSVVESPGAAANKKKAKFKTNLMKAIDDGKWEEGNASYSTEDWKQVTRDKGGARFADGIAKSEAKTLAFHQEFSNYVGTVKSKVDAMPDATPEQRDQKMLENARQLRKFRRTKRRR